MVLDASSKRRFDLYFIRYIEVNRLAFEHTSLKSRMHDRFRITDAEIFNNLLEKDELPIYAALLYATNLIAQVADFYIQSGRLCFDGENKKETFPEFMGILSDAYRHVCPSLMPLFILKSIDPKEDYWDIFKGGDAWQNNKSKFDAGVEWCCSRMDDFLEILSTTDIYKEKKYEIISLVRSEHQRISNKY